MESTVDNPPKMEEVDQNPIDETADKNEVGQQREENLNSEEPRTAHDIPEEVFVEYKRPLQNKMEPIEQKSLVNDLRSLYQFLERNLDKQGYEDALMNPDSSFMEAHLQYINNELTLLISKVKTYYGNHLRDVNFTLIRVSVME